MPDTSVLATPHQRINSFFGIRYVLPPTGERRWQQPTPIDGKPWPAQKPIINATAPGPHCIAINNFPWIPGSAAPDGLESYESEDCLYLNVLVPRNPASAKLPVLVNIHGGGYVGGVPENGDAFVHQAQGEVIFVAIQYRLGVFGFLAGDEIRESGAANAGLLDQREALDWIQRHIGSFGGDPDKVTIMGGSAGGGSVSIQMMLHGGQQPPPFRAAIPEYAWWTPMYNQTWVDNQYRRVLESSSCADVSCLRNLPAAALNNAAWRAWKAALDAAETVYGLFYYGPTIDGEAVLGSPAEQFRAGNFSKVPVLVDRDMFEGPTFTPVTLSTGDELVADLRAVWQTVPDALIREVVELYPSSTYNSSLVRSTPWFNALTGGYNVSTAFVQRQAIFGVSVVDCPSTAIVQASVDAGQKAYKMVFEAGSQLHGATAPYLWSKNIGCKLCSFPFTILGNSLTCFDSVDGASTLGATSFPGNATLAHALRHYVAAFAINLDPNQSKSSVELPLWPEFTNEDRQILHMQEDSIGVAHDFDFDEQCDMLNSLSTL
ncbi:triacylglycerol lipase [Colletotrichum musicola]|uniref:Carboxylic ester hydrolase n=1 Tax=Colletotrichum musicola TaxID=2175873 RepID=A0A8H6N0C3_9PEZI|nr:triacylglycerol lipase [Colletotrichum musicola]